MAAIAAGLILWLTLRALRTGPRVRSMRRRVGEFMASIGAASLVAIPAIWFQRYQGNDPQADRAWFWPTWWMLVPAGMVVVGLVLWLWPHTTPDAAAPSAPSGGNTFHVQSHGQRGGTTAAQVYGRATDDEQRRDPE